jgi:dTDP-4-dehydrorhamnose reductase
VLPFDIAGGNHTRSMASLRILVTGATGFLGTHVTAAVKAAGHRALSTGRRGGDVAVDLLAPGMVAAVVQAAAPDLVIHLAALSRLDECERDPAAALRTNAWLPEQFAERFGARLVHVSTDLVFDGAHAPYEPHDPIGPLSVYGQSKAQGEERVRAHGGRVVRLPLLFGPDELGRGATASLRAALQQRRPVSLYPNEYRTPLHAADAAAALVALAVEPDGPGLVHLAGPERVSRWELGRRFVQAQGLDEGLLQPVECVDPLRPRDVSLAGEWRAVRSLSAMLADS